jgi:hypothetical protein
MKIPKSLLILFLTSLCFSSTITTLFDHSRAETYWYKGAFEGGNFGEALINYNELNNNAISFIQFDLNPISSLSFDHAYLGLTELRSGSFAQDVAVLYSYLGDGVAFGNGDITSDWNQEKTLVQDFETKGIGGNLIYLDVTNVVTTFLTSANQFVGFRLEDPSINGHAPMFLGRNYNSGFPEQYYAQSQYEYPTLIFTSGNEITPFNEHPSLPIINEPIAFPLHENNPPSVPEPTSLALFILGVIFLIKFKKPIT